MGIDKKLHDSVSRRGVLMGAIQLVCAVGIAGKFYQLQIVKGDEYATLSENNYIRTEFITPQRGEILDRHGRVVAKNENRYVVKIDSLAVSVNELYTYLDRLRRVIALSPFEINAIIADAKTLRRGEMLKIADNLSVVQAQELLALSPNFRGVQVVAFTDRRYPLGQAMSHILGYLGPIGKDHAATIPRHDWLRRVPDILVGRRGLERVMDQSLRGTPGLQYSEYGVHGRRIRYVNSQKNIRARKGSDVYVTIDAAIQLFAMRQLAEHKAAAAVVLDAHSGDVLAATSVPSYDPALFQGGIDSYHWQQLQNNPQHPLLNRAMQGLYAPGSTIKPFFALAALESGIGQGLVVNCSGKFAYGDTEFHCWKKHGHGRVGVTRAIRESCDVWFYEAGLKLGLRTLRTHARAMGFGAAPDLPLEGISGGLVPSADWKLRHHDQVWVHGDTIVLAIGQGYFLASPLQMAVATARLVTGKDVQPKITYGGERAFDDLPFSRRNRDIVTKGMYEAVNHGAGTAQNIVAADDDIKIAGKTGTVQVRRISQFERESGLIAQEDLPWRLRDHAMFIAYAPFDAPRWVVAVVVEHAISGARVAAPIAKRILHHTRQRMGTQRA